MLTKQRFFAFSFCLLLTSGVYGATNEDTEKINHLEEFKTALAKVPDIDHGRELYLNCISCHGPEGWGTENGDYPQIAGQLPSVIIKQLEDIRAGNRSNPIMRAFTSSRVLKDAQDIADVAAYVAALPMTPYNGQGPRLRIAYGAQVYADNCTECHGKQAEGDEQDHIPLLQGQHYFYLLRQFEHIRSGLRRNADEKMVKQIRRFTPREETAVMAYTASLKPPESKLAAPGWRNPDFPDAIRPPFPAPPPPFIGNISIPESQAER